MRLLVRQFDRLVGFLESTPDRGVVFRYVGEYLREPGAHALSLSLPLREAEFSQAATMPFFAGLLPDGDLRRRVSDSLHVSESSTLKLLDALGGECAGTVSLLRDEEDEDIRRASPSPKGTQPGCISQVDGQGPKPLVPLAQAVFSYLRNGGRTTGTWD
jgi:HipA-like protein